MPPRSAPSIDLKRFNRFPNFGDELASFILSKLWEGPINVIGRESHGRSNLVMIGSILAWSDPWSIVCGAGALSPQHVPFAAKRVLAVRGPLSNQVLRSAGLPAAAVLGDPGYLLPHFLPLPPGDADEIGVIPHYVDMTEDLLAAARDEGVRVIDVLAPIETIGAEIAACGTLICSSLHGLIAADAYGRRSVWARFGGPLHGGEFKFHDYLRSQSLLGDHLEPCEGFSTLRQAAEQAYVKPRSIRSDDLLAAVQEAINEAAHRHGHPSSAQ